MHGVVDILGRIANIFSSMANIYLPKTHFFPFINQDYFLKKNLNPSLSKISYWNDAQQWLHQMHADESIWP